MISSCRIFRLDGGAQLTQTHIEAEKGFGTWKSIEFGKTIAMELYLSVLGKILQMA